MTYAEFLQSFKSDHFAPIYLFHGEEDLLIDEGIQLIVSKALDEGTKGFNLDVVYGSKAEAKDVVAHATSFPMMSAKRVVVVKEFEKLATTEIAKEIVSAYVNNPLESTVLVLVSIAPDFRKKPFTDLKKRAEVIECKPLYDNQVPAWIAERIKRQGREANAEACRLMQAYVGNSLRSLQNEIDKLFVFIGDRKKVNVEDIAAVVGATKGYTIFELQNAIGRKDAKESIRILERMLEAGQAPLMIIVMLTRFFTQLWKLSDMKARRMGEQEIAREIGVPPYYVKQYIEFRSNFDVDQIEQNFKALLEADTVMKSTSRDPHLVLDLLVLSLMHRSTEPVGNLL
ncbi:MAG: DNA polymerase III subunit delta [Ignavibacteriales bacterium]|nr:DNA polymerase III subunit delta [Ignavibacteriales bacterium]